MPDLVASCASVFLSAVLIELLFALFDRLVDWLGRFFRKPLERCEDCGGTCFCASFDDSFREELAACDLCEIEKKLFKGEQNGGDRGGEI